MKERLTIRNSDGSVSQPTHSTFEKVFNRLAELEDKIERGTLKEIPENAVVLTREEYEELQKGVKTHNYTATFNAMEADRWLDGYKQGFKEGVEAVQIQLKEQFADSARLCEQVDEICKELEGDNGQST